MGAVQKIEVTDSVEDWDDEQWDMARFFDEDVAALSRVEVLALKAIRGMEDKELFEAENKNQLDDLKRSLTRREIKEAKQIDGRLRLMGGDLISFLDKITYPMKLLSLGSYRPALLYCRGNLRLLEHEAVGIIGTRVISERGFMMAGDMGMLYGGKEIDRRNWLQRTGCPSLDGFPGLDKEEYVVVGGLASGCDTATHQGCLGVGGKSVAVVTTGLDRVYPQRNEMLQWNILKEGGLIITEQPFGTLQKGYLQDGNRIVAALSNRLMVVECRIKSEASETVRWALDLEKDIYAVDYGLQAEWNSGNVAMLREKVAKPIPYPF